MAQFIVKVNGAKPDLIEEEEIQKELEEIHKSLLDLSGNMNFKVASTVGIKKNLTTLASRVERHKNDMCSMKHTLDGVIRLYEKTEKEVCGYAIGGVVKAAELESTGKVYMDTETAFANTGSAEKNVVIQETMEWVRESLRELTNKRFDKEALEKWLLMVTEVCGSIQTAVSIVKKLFYPMGSVAGFSMNASEQVKDFICKKIEDIERKEKEDRMNAIQLIRNNESDNAPGFVKDGCIVTAMANLYRRKLAYENRTDDVDRETFRVFNNSIGEMRWELADTRMKQNFGYGIAYEGGPKDLNSINQLLSEHPEGIMVFSQGRENPSKPSENYCHAILIVGQENGRYKVVDPIDGAIKYWEDCYSVSSPHGTFPGWTIENFLQNTNRLAYISG